MTPRAEVAPGDIVRMDTDALRTIGGSLTNAQATGGDDRAVRGTHDFLVLAVDAGAGRVAVLPLFPRSAPGSAPLDDRLRTGPAEWLGAPVFYSRWQHWQVPLEALAQATTAGDSEDGTPRRYAADKPDVLQDLLNWSSRNRCAFRPA